MFDLSPAFWQPPRRFSCFFVGVAASSQPERAHERKNLQLWGFFSFSMQPNTPLGLFLRQRRRPRRIQKFSSTFSKVKFSSTFFKRWQVPRAAPLAAIRRWRNAPCFRRIWGVWGDFARENPPRASLFCALFAAVASPRGRWREAPVGALPGRWGFFSWGGLASPFRQCLPLQGRCPFLPHDLPHRGRWPGASTQPQPPLLGEVARRAGEVVLQEGPRWRDPSAAWRRQLPLQGEPKRGPCLSDFPAATGRGCRVSPRQAIDFLGRPRKSPKKAA